MVDWEKIDIEEKNKIPLFVYHGTHDKLFELQNVESSYRYLQQNGIKVNIQVE